MKNINRRIFLRLSGSTIFTTALFSSGTILSANKRPNIIMFLTDDQDKESINAYHGKTWSPNLDQMAREGILFHHAYVSSTVCTPSRYTFLTGRYAGNSYSEYYKDEVKEGTQGFPSFNMALENDRMNVGSILRKNGYVAGYVGKFHVSSDLDFPQLYKENGPKKINKRSARDSKETREKFKHNELWMQKYIKECGFSWAKHMYEGNMQRPYNSHNPGWTIQAALEFIEENKGRPFYLHYCTTLLHGPNKQWRTSMDYPLVSGEGILKKPPNVMTGRKELLALLRKKGLDPLEGHAGNAWVDDSLGSILKKLKSLGIDRNTLVVFCSDHGSNYKASLFSKDGVNIPCIMRWPDGIKKGKICNELIQNIDFVPTFFDLAGAKVPKGYHMDGRSLVPLFKEKKPEKWRDHLYFELGFARAIYSKGWKYIAVRYTKEQISRIKKANPEKLPKLMSYINRLGIGVRGANHPGFFDEDQLYNLDKDPDEMKNLAKNPEYKEKIKQMKKLLTQSIKKQGRPFGEFVPGDHTLPAGQIDEQIKMIKKIKIRGKKIILPDGSVHGKGSKKKKKKKK